MAVGGEEAKLEKEREMKLSSQRNVRTRSTKLDEQEIQVSYVTLWLTPTTHLSVRNSVRKQEERETER